MFKYIYIYIYIYTHTYIHTYTHTYTYSNCCLILGLNLISREVTVCPLKIVGLPGRQYMVPVLPLRLPWESQQKCLFAEDKWGTTPYIAGRNCRLPQSGRTSPLEPRQSAATAVFGLEKRTIGLRTALFWVITQTVVVISYHRFRTTYRSLLQGSRIHNKACVYRYHTCYNFFYHATSLSTAALTTTLPSLPTLLAGTSLLRHFTAHTLLYINSVLRKRAFFWAQDPWKGGWYVVPKRR